MHDMTKHSWQQPCYASNSIRLLAAAAACHCNRTQLLGISDADENH